MITTIENLKVGDEINLKGIHGKVTEIRRYKSETGISFVKTYGSREELDFICNDWIILNDDGTITGNITKQNNYKISLI